jgi:hypothetical protein
MLIITLVLAVIGTTAGVLSLAWQMLSFRRTGPVVKLRVDLALPVHDKNGKLIEILRITACNVGCSPIKIAKMRN